MSVATKVRWALGIEVSPDPMHSDEAHDALLDSGFLCNAVPACTAATPHDTCRRRTARVLEIIRFRDVDRAIEERDAWRDWESDIEWMQR